MSIGDILTGKYLDNYSNSLNKIIKAIQVAKGDTEKLKHLLSKEK